MKRAKGLTSWRRLDEAAPVLRRIVTITHNSQMPRRNRHRFDVQLPRALTPVPAYIRQAVTLRRRTIHAHTTTNSADKCIQGGKPCQCGKCRNLILCRTKNDPSPNEKGRFFTDCQGSGSASGAISSVKVNVAPLPTSLCTPIVPFMCSHTSLAIDSPRPVPVVRIRDLSAL